eukprot:1161604-Pelagomonas_calceolata.AAC.1
MKLNTIILQGKFTASLSCGQNRRAGLWAICTVGVCSLPSGWTLPPPFSSLRVLKEANMWDEVNLLNRRQNQHALRPQTVTALQKD